MIVKYTRKDEFIIDTKILYDVYDFEKEEVEKLTLEELTTHFSCATIRDLCEWCIDKNDEEYTVILKKDP